MAGFIPQTLGEAPARMVAKQPPGTFKYLKSKIQNTKDRIQNTVQVKTHWGGNYGCGQRYHHPGYEHLGASFRFSGGRVSQPMFTRCVRAMETAC